MAFADLKNDFVFRRIFATHPDILRGLLNDLLDRRDKEAIVLHRVPAERAASARGRGEAVDPGRPVQGPGGHDVRGGDAAHPRPGVHQSRSSTTPASAYVGQLKVRDKFKQLADVVAISICDFELWPDAKQEKQKLPLVPMLSRWHMTESTSGSLGALAGPICVPGVAEAARAQASRRGGAAYWAWLFVTCAGAERGCRPIYRAGAVPGGAGARRQGDVLPGGARRVPEGGRRDPAGAGSRRRQVGLKARPPAKLGRFSRFLRLAASPVSASGPRSNRGMQGPDDTRSMDRPCGHGELGRGGHRYALGPLMSHTMLARGRRPTPRCTSTSALQPRSARQGAPRVTARPFGGPRR